MSKYIQIPAPIKLKEMVTRKETGDEYDFWKFIQVNLLTDMRFGQDWKAGRMQERLTDRLFGKNPGEWVELESSDYDMLKEVAQKPKYRRMNAHGQVEVVEGYEPLLLAQIGYFIEVIVEKAQDKKPE